MARILYGIHGTGHGHAMRGLILARALPWHEFLFVANDDAPGVLMPEFPVRRLPNLGTVFKNYRVDLGATIRRALPILLRRQAHVREALKIIEEFKPDVCLTDLEYFVPAAASLAGVPCMALDHQHIVTCARHKAPLSLRYDLLLQGLTPRWLFRPQQANIIISFYSPPLRPGWNARIMPPILRDITLKLAPEDQGHILVYQSNSTDAALIDFLASVSRRPAHIFGFINEERRSGRLHFHKRDEALFQHLLAGASYVIQGGSHTLMSEALYLGKPILSLPLRAMVEQRLNSFYLEKLGYGRQCRMAELSATLLAEFENRLPFYKANISKGRFLGNQPVFDLVDKFARSARAPDFRT